MPAVGAFQAFKEDPAVGQRTVGSGAGNSQAFGQCGEAVSFSLGKEFFEDGDRAFKRETAGDAALLAPGVEEAAVEAGVVGEGGRAGHELVGFLQHVRQRLAVGVEHEVGDSGDASDLPRHAAADAHEAADFTGDFEGFVDAKGGDFGDFVAIWREPGRFDVDQAERALAEDRCGAVWQDHRSMVFPVRKLSSAATTMRIEAMASSM